MTMRRFHRIGMLAAAALIAALATGGPGPLMADPDPTPATSTAPPPAASSKTPASKKPAAKKPAKKKPAAKKPAKKKKKTSSTEQRFEDGYRAAYALAEAGRHAEALAGFRALGRDEHPSVANMVGFLNRHLGHYEEAQVWYERALASDPGHVRTWQYYGMWHVEQGNMLKAREHLDRIRALCGGETCQEFASLKGAIEGTVVY